MTNFKNDLVYQIINAKATIPASAAITGTVTTNGIYISGVGTKFITNSELRRGFWLVDLTNNEIRMVDQVDSDTVARLNKPFTADFSSVATPQAINTKDLDIRQISVSIDSGLGNGSIAGAPLTAGGGRTFGKTSDYTRNAYAFIDPLIADATGTIIDVSILK